MVVFILTASGFCNLQEQIKILFHLGVAVFALRDDFFCTCGHLLPDLSVQVLTFSLCQTASGISVNLAHDLPPVSKRVIFSFSYTVYTFYAFSAVFRCLRTIIESICFCFRDFFSNRPHNFLRVCLLHFADVCPHAVQSRANSIKGGCGNQLPGVHHIQASKFLSEKKTRDLINALEHQCSRHEAVSLQRQVVIANRFKTIASSNTLFGNVDRIHKAINLNAQITFKYFSYDAKKQKQYMSKGELYTASPWTIIYADDNYYLLAYEKGTIKHFRVDKMDNVTPCVETFELTGEEVVTLPHEGKEEFEKVDMSAYSKYTFSMYGGKIQNVTMRFQNRMMGVVMDRFGRDVVTTVVDKEHFQITVPVAVSDQFYGWVFGLGNYVTIVGPDSVKEGMRKALAKVTKRYE